MCKRTVFRLIAILIINSFLLLDIAWAGAGQISASDKQTDTLSAPIEISQQVFNKSFGKLYEMNSPKAVIQKTAKNEIANSKAELNKPRPLGYTINILLTGIKKIIGSKYFWAGILGSLIFVKGGVFLWVILSGAIITISVIKILSKVERRSSVTANFAMILGITITFIYFFSFPHDKFLSDKNMFSSYSIADAKDLEVSGNEEQENFKRLKNDLESESKVTRSLAAYDFGGYKSRKAVVCLMKALKDEESDVRGAAARSLGEIGDEFAVDGLIEIFLTDSSDFASREAFKALTKINNDKAKFYCNLAQIETFYSAEGEKIYNEILKIKRINEFVLEVLTRKVLTRNRNDLYSVWWHAVKLSGVLKEKRAVSPLLQKLTPYSNSIIVETLGEIADITAVKPLLKHAGSFKWGNPEQEIEDALVKIGEKGIPQILEVLNGELEAKKSRDWYNVPKIIYRVLGRIGDESVIEVIKKIDKQESDWSNRFIIKEVLAERGALDRAVIDELLFAYARGTDYALRILGIMKDERANFYYHLLTRNFDAALAGTRSSNWELEAFTNDNIDRFAKEISVKIIDRKLEEIILSQAKENNEVNVDYLLKVLAVKGKMIDVDSAIWKVLDKAAHILVLSKESVDIKELTNLLEKKEPCEIFSRYYSYEWDEFDHSRYFAAFVLGEKEDIRAIDALIKAYKTEKTKYVRDAINDAIKKILANEKIYTKIKVEILKHPYLSLLVTIGISGIAVFAKLFIRRKGKANNIRLSLLPFMLIALGPTFGWAGDGMVSPQELSFLKYLITEYWLVAALLSLAAGIRFGIGILRTFYPVEWVLYWFDNFCFDREERETYKGRLVVVARNGGEKVLNKLHKILETGQNEKVRGLVAEVIIVVEGMPAAEEENRDLLERLQVSGITGVYENLLKLDMPRAKEFYKVIDASNIFGRRERAVILELLPELADSIDKSFVSGQREQAWQIVTQSIAKIAKSDFYKSWEIIKYAPRAIEAARGDIEEFRENMRVLEDIADAIRKHKWQYWWMFSFVSVEELIKRHPDADGIERLISIDADLGHMEGKRTLREREEIRMMISAGASLEVLEFLVNLAWACFKKFTIAERKVEGIDVKGAEFINDDTSESNYSYVPGSSIWDMVPVADIFFGSSAKFDISSETVRNRYYYFRVVKNFMKLLGDMGITADSFVKKFNMLLEAEKAQFFSSLTPYNIKERIENLGNKNSDLLAPIVKDERVMTEIEQIINEDEPADAAQAQLMTIDVDQTTAFTLIRAEPNLNQLTLIEQAI